MILILAKVLNNSNNKFIQGSCPDSYHLTDKNWCEKCSSTKCKRCEGI